MKKQPNRTPHAFRAYITIDEFLKIKEEAEIEKAKPVINDTLELYGIKNKSEISNKNKQNESI